MALVPGNMVASGTGVWTLASDGMVTSSVDEHLTDGLHFTQQAPGSAISDANVQALPDIQLGIDLKTLGPVHIAFMGDKSTKAPSPVDSIGYTSGAEIDIVNDTGQPIHNLLLTLANANPQTPLNLVPGVIQFGDGVNANYAYFTGIQPIPGVTTVLASADGNPTTPTGAATSTIALAGDFAPGSTTALRLILHNTELTTSNNDFTLTVTPS